MLSGPPLQSFRIWPRFRSLYRIRLPDVPFSFTPFAVECSLGSMLRHSEYAFMNHRRHTSSIISRSRI
jgi:hypothetical protein